MGPYHVPSTVLGLREKVSSLHLKSNCLRFAAGLELGDIYFHVLI